MKVNKYVYWVYIYIYYFLEKVYCFFMNEELVKDLDIVKDYDQR